MDEISDSKVNELMTDMTARSQKLHQVLLAVEDAPGAIPGNGWGVLNAVTYWADHIAGRSRDKRLNNAWFGENAALKLKVEKGLLELTA